MNDSDDLQSVEDLLGRYRPADAPARLLHRLQQPARSHRQGWSERLRGALWTAASMLLGLLVRGTIAALAVLSLMMATTKGH